MGLQFLKTVKFDMARAEHTDPENLVLKEGITQSELPVYKYPALQIPRPMNTPPYKYPREPGLEGGKEGIAQSELPVRMASPTACPAHISYGILVMAY